jgi:tetratricopeptide (TPR) repeat protein
LKIVRDYGKCVLILLAVLVGAADIAAQCKEEKSSILSEAALTALVKKDPNSYQTHVQAARFYQEKGFIGQAQDEYKKAIALPNAQPDAFKQLSNLYLRSHDYDLAIKISEDACKKFPDNFGVQLSAGYALHNQQRLDEALICYEKARKIKPNSPDIYVAIADVQLAMNKPKEALASVDKALKLGGDMQMARFEKAKILTSLERYEEAVKEMAVIFEQDPFSQVTTPVYLSCLLKTGRKDIALEVRLCMLSQANGKEMQTDKSAVGALIQQVNESQVSQAIVRAEKRILEPKLKARLHFAMGDVFDRGRLPEKAIEQYQAGLKWDDTFARGYLRLAEDLEYYRHDFTGALKNYEKAKALDPSDKETVMRYGALRSKLGMRSE